MSEILSFKDLGISEDEVEMDFVDEEDGGRVDVRFKTYNAEEVFRAACARARLSPEEYLRTLLGLK
jgi:hypothetical protein